MDVHFACNMVIVYSISIQKSQFRVMADLRSLFRDLGGVEKLLSAAISSTTSPDLPESRGTDPHSSLMPPLQLEKGVNASKKKAEDPQIHQLFAVNLMKKKDVGVSGVRDCLSDTELGLGLSLNYDPQVEAQVSVLPATGNSIRRKLGFLLGESSTLQGSASDLQLKDRKKTSMSSTTTGATAALPPAFSASKVGFVKANSNEGPKTHGQQQPSSAMPFSDSGAQRPHIYDITNLMEVTG